MDSFIYHVIDMVFTNKYSISSLHLYMDGAIGDSLRKGKYHWKASPSPWGLLPGPMASYYGYYPYSTG